ncbi:Sodium/hydrogen exchanger family-domain-containing protein [Pelagophyceae sp. CCMP2097]|nr:Sodium/hydrogen exchanger family-domain-containing protein [Pelagophyceae sp. CCMP2097]
MRLRGVARALVPLALLLCALARASPSETAVEAAAGNGTGTACGQESCHCESSHGAEGEHYGGQNAHFEAMFSLILFMCCVWVSGKVVSATGQPALVGEIFTGVILGPHLYDFVPYPEMLALFGNVGLCLHALEVGLHVDVEMLELVGSRGLVVAVAGSALPVLLGYFAATAWGASLHEAFTVGAALATVSPATTVGILKAEGALNQPLGQLIIAAATMNEMVNIALLTQVETMVYDRGVVWHVLPVAFMVALVGLVGAAAIYAIPPLVDRHVLPRVVEDQRASAVLGLIFFAALVLVPVCKYSGSSEVLGAFLAGLCFCGDHIAQETFDRQAKRVLHWLMRLFFACTIGFTVPAHAILDPHTLAKAAVLFLCSLAKLAVGFLAEPLDAGHAGALACAWGAWGEFSFLIASVARRKSNHGFLPNSTYDAIVLAVVFSILVYPYGMRLAFAKIKATARKRIDEAVLDTADVSGKLHAAYYCIQTKSHAHWAQQHDLLRAVRMGECEVIDFRTWHPNDHFGVAHCVCEIYVKDLRLQLPVVADLPEACDHALQKRISGILSQLETALHDTTGSAEVRIQRWLPGAHLELDAQGHAELVPNAEPAQCDEAAAAEEPRGLLSRLPSLSLLASQVDLTRLSFDAHSSSSPRHGDDDDASSVASEAPSLDALAPPCLSRRHRSTSEALGLSHGYALHRIASRSSISRALDSDSFAGAFHVEPSHELDGYVHTDAHKPFDLPDDYDHDVDAYLMDPTHHGMPSDRESTARGSFSHGGGHHARTGPRSPTKAAAETDAARDALAAVAAADALLSPPPRLSFSQPNLSRDFSQPHLTRDFSQPTPPRLARDFSQPTLEAFNSDQTCASKGLTALTLPISRGVSAPDFDEVFFTDASRAPSPPPPGPVTWADAPRATTPPPGAVT